MIKAGQYLHAGAADDDVVLMLGTSTKLVHCIVVAADGITILADSFHGNMVSATDYKIADEDAAQFIPKIPNNTIFVLDSKTVLEFHTQYPDTDIMRNAERRESQNPHPSAVKVGDKIIVENPRFRGKVGVVTYVDKNGLTADLGLESGYRPVLMQGEFKLATEAGGRYGIGDYVKFKKPVDGCMFGQVKGFNLGKDATLMPGGLPASGSPVSSLIVRVGKTAGDIDYASPKATTTRDNIEYRVRQDGKKYEKGPNLHRLTPDSAANLRSGDVVVDGSGKEYRAYSARHDWLKAHPIVNGKAVVNADSGVTFLLTPSKADAYPERINEPVYATGRNVNEAAPYASFAANASYKPNIAKQIRRDLGFKESGSLFTITSRDTGAILKVAGTAEDIQHYEDMGQNVSYTLYAPNKHKGESRRRYAQGSYDSPKVTPAKAQSTALRWLDGDLKAEAAPAQNIDHNEYPRRLRTKSTAELKFAQSDAQAAMKAMPDGPKAGYYADEINYISMELARRAKGGK
jgi:hypothetical protein